MKNVARASKFSENHKNPPRSPPANGAKKAASEFSENRDKILPYRPRDLKQKGHNLSLGPLRFALTTPARVRQSAGGCRTQQRSQVGQKSKNTPRTSPKPCQRHPASGSPSHPSPPRCAEGRHKTPRRKLGAAVVPPRGCSINSKWVPKKVLDCPFGPSCWSPWWKKRPGWCPDGQKSAPGLRILRKS